MVKYLEILRQVDLKDLSSEEEKFYKLCSFFFFLIAIDIDSIEKNFWIERVQGKKNRVNWNVLVENVG